ncbi:pentatricopeptide repeat-containing protein At1g71210, mitochondrial [Apium graveolens]|uniref:pentatricopeptide repeat-containing protein At1g71210, mitochondrial n=1 Tax=Apium graveolens TaxID=4045 RepID=UPI003D7AA307
MLSLRNMNRIRVFITPLPCFDSCYNNYRYSSFLSPVCNDSVNQLRAHDVVLAFKEWFRSREICVRPCLDSIYVILNNTDDAGLIDFELSKLELRLDERFVLEVLNSGEDVLSCLKFFDWAGRQRGFVHTRATFYAIFKVLSKARLMTLMTDFLDSYRKQSGICKTRFYNTLVMGYAVAGKPDVALRVFGKMRFHGLDLDEYCYHVLLNALAEQSCFDAFDMVAKQIEFRGLKNCVTHAVLVKGLCKKKEWDRAESYTREFVASGMGSTEAVIGTLVAGLCKEKMFERAAEVVEEFGGSKVPLQTAYNMWIRDLVRVGQLEGALNILKKMKGMDGPDVFRYNLLINKLLRKNRHMEVYDLFMEMMERQLCPDEDTMNCVLCFFCKIGHVDEALHLYDAKVELGLSPNRTTYNFLITTLCAEGNTDEAYRVLRGSLTQGYIPGQNSFSIVADALCRERKVDEMKDLVFVALERNFAPSSSIYSKFISAMSKNNRVEDGYMLHGQLNLLNKVTSRHAYMSLIDAFRKTNRGDIAVRLLIEMQEKGHDPTPTTFKRVIELLFDMDNPEQKFFRMLEIQLSRQGQKRHVYRLFIFAAGHARKPELAKAVYDKMLDNNITPDVKTNIHMLLSYLKSERTATAVRFFNDLKGERKAGKKLHQCLIIGLCRMDKVDMALSYVKEMKRENKTPSLRCYEELVLVLCNNNKYDEVVDVVDDTIRDGRTLSTFIGNLLLLHSFRAENLYYYWVRSRHNTTSFSWEIGELIRAFSPYITDIPDIEDLEEVIQQLFPMDVFTYNLLIRRVIMAKRIPSGRRMERARALFKRLCQKGLEPNKMTFDYIVHGYAKFGMKSEAKRWSEEMERRGFEHTSCTKLLL